MWALKFVVPFLLVAPGIAEAFDESSSEDDMSASDFSEDVLLMQTGMAHPSSVNYRLGTPRASQMTTVELDAAGNIDISSFSQTSVEVQRPRGIMSVTMTAGGQISGC
mmetsp:Transcript_24888/g.55262  ORF Transcript_24888/g.55262 Transcript_24888/m.55262 type:complete len:108 (+) Transcript_24888:83-406(+)